MKLVACLLLLSGFFLVLTALVLLSSLPQRFAFTVAGFGVEIVGLALLTQGYRTSGEDQK